jgi:predicted dehydrogenase
MITGAVIGLGKIAQTAHMPAYCSEPLQERAQIAAAAEPDEHVRSEAQKKFPWLRVYPSVEEMFACEELQFVDICTPPHLHASMIRLALEHDLHIICEKPFAVNPQEAECLAADLKSKPGIVFAPCHQYKYSPLWNAAHAFVKKKEKDERVFMQSAVYRTAPDPGIAADGKGWRRNWAVSGGGILTDTGVHYFALAEWMFGMPEAVSCRTYHLDSEGEGVAEDTAIVELKHPGGVFQFNLTWAADRRANLLRAVTPHRSFVYDGGTKALEYHDGACKSIVSVPDTADKTHYIGLYEKLFADFYTMIERGARNDALIDSALHTAVVLDAAYKSAESDAVVYLREYA